MDKVLTTYRPFWETGKRYRILYGGAGSGKSVNVAQNMIRRAGESENVRVLTVRKVARTCRYSTFQLYKDVVKGMNRHEVTIREQAMELEFPGGGKIIHAGLDDEQKLKSLSGITHIWVEEATDLDFPEADEEEDDLAQLDLRLRGVPSGLDPCIVLSFNPVHSATDLFKYVGVDTEDLPTRDWIEVGDAYVQHTTYEDNPFVSDEYLSAFRRLGGTMETIYVGGEIARSDAPDQVITYDHIKTAKDTEPQDGLSALGVDPARFGDDDTAFATLRGNVLLTPETHSSLDTSRVATVTTEKKQSLGCPWSRVGMDTVGIGAGAYDQLLGEAVSIKGGSDPVEWQDGRETEHDFYDLRAQLCWALRLALKNGEIHLQDPSDRFVEDLCAARYSFQRDQQIRVESKSDIKPRLGRSPDLGDAATYVVGIDKLQLAGNRMPFAVV
jgi:hypothetical protein